MNWLGINNSKVTLKKMLKGLVEGDFFKFKINLQSIANIFACKQRPKIKDKVKTIKLTFSVTNNQTSSQQFKA
jgi:hypothetical protein